MLTIAGGIILAILILCFLPLIIVIVAWLIGPILGLAFGLMIGMTAGGGSEQALIACSVFGLAAGIGLSIYIGREIQ